MNYNIKQKFTAKDLQVGDLMYDAQESVVVKIAFVGSTTYKKVTAITLFTAEVGVIAINQIVLENVDSKEIYVLEVIGKEGILPKLNSGKPRFRHLIKNDNTYTGTINWNPGGSSNSLGELK